jgi:hypothetical protein
VGEENMFRALNPAGFSRRAIDAVCPYAGSNFDNRRIDAYKITSAASFDLVFSTIKKSSTRSAICKMVSPSVFFNLRQVTPGSRDAAKYSPHPVGIFQSNCWTNAFGKVDSRSQQGENTWK